MPVFNRAWYLFFLALPLAVAIRVEMIGLSGPAHDEVISIMFAQGNAGKYEKTKASLAGRWVPASEWKAFLGTPSDAGYMSIERDLSEMDVHPPLYFWLLRFWIKAFGPEAARWMNVPFMLLTAAVLFVFATRCLGVTGGALATSLWLLSPETFRITAITRSFEVLALIVVLIALQTTRIIEGRRDYWNIAVLGVLALAGMLTQYLAAFVVLTAIGLIGMRRRDALIPTLGAMAVAAIVFVLLHPGFYLQFSRHETVLGFAGRVQEVASTLLGFFGWRRPWTTPTLAYAAISMIFVAGVIYAIRRWRTPIPVAFAVFPVALNLVAYLATLTPSYAFIGRHLSFAWPFVAIVLSMVVLKVAPKLMPAALVAVVLIAGPLEFWIVHNRTAAQSMTKNTPQIVLNNLSMGILPRYLFDVDDGTMVFAAKDLGANTQWLGDLQPGALAIINPQYEMPGDVERSKAALQGLEIVSQEWTTTVYRR